MTLSILGSKGLKGGSMRTAAIYLFVTVLCLVFSLVYNQFSYGVYSPFMTWLFMWPLVLGFFPGAFWEWCFQLRRPGRVAENLYHSGVAAVTVSSLLRGILEIAGTASEYQEWLMWIGGIMLIAAVAAYLLKM